jgi:hypothetical protein
MEPKAFLALADLLVLGTPKAANLRTATSRAYYATHHVGARVLKQLNLTVPRGPQAHQEVADLLQNSGDKDIQAIGTGLQDLYGARRRADYELENQRPEQLQTVRGHVAQARQMISSLETCLAEPKRSTVGAAIRLWDLQRKTAIAAAARKP